MKSYKISINQLADFYIGTDAKKRRIVSQQKSPKAFMVAYYQLAKARIRKALQHNGDLEPVLNGIAELKSRKPEKKRQISDKIVSIEAMERFIKLKLPKVFVNTEYEIIKAPKDKKSINLNGVEIIVSPEVIIRGKVDGQSFIGGFKIHVSKSNKFTREQQKIVSSALFKYLKDVIATDGEIVLPELCISLDIFSDGVVATSPNVENTIRNIESLCDEVKQLWNVA